MTFRNSEGVFGIGDLLGTGDSCSCHCGGWLAAFLRLYPEASQLQIYTRDSLTGKKDRTYPPVPRWPLSVTSPLRSRGILLS